MNNLNILQCRDTYDSYKKYKGAHLPSLPTKIAIVGKSAISGKTTILSNLVNRSEYFGNDFEGSNIYLISKSINSDDKLKNIIKYKEIPEENLFDSIDDDILNLIMDIIKEKYNESIDDEETPKHSLVILDDISFDSYLSSNKNNNLNELVCNMRHYLTSCIFTAQKFTQLGTTIRSNCIYFMIFKQSLRELKCVMGDINYLSDSKIFKKLFNKSTEGAHDMFICNLDAKPENIYCQCGDYSNNMIRPAKND